jgi:hypothetical protein
MTLESNPNTYDVTDIFQILDIIEKRPGLFILNRNLDNLYCFIRGYKTLSDSGHIAIKNLDQLDNLSVFIQKDLNEVYVNTFGWFGYIRAEYGHEEKGFLKFFEYYNKFKVSNGIT